jgi:hypothetical protein
MQLTPAKQWTLQQIIYADALKEIDAHFSTLGVPYMPVKGAYLICSGLASQLRQREMKDIDILVGETSMRQVSNYFARLNKTVLQEYFTENYRPTETSLLYNIDNTVIQLELHSSLNFPERFLLPERDLFSRALPANGYRRLPSPEDALLIFLCHLQSHMPFEFRASTFDEIGVLSSANGFDWDRFRSRCPSTGMEAFIYFILRAYARERRVLVPVPGNHPYAGLLARWFTPVRYAALPGWARRILFDIPFVRNPGWLIRHKLYRGSRKK